MESLRIEYKGTLSRGVLDGLGSDLAACANAKGGEIWFGINDKGQPTGSHLSELDRQSVAQKAARCRPPVRIDFDEREHEGHQITVVIVPESTSIHMDDRHRFPIRIGGIKDYLDATGVLLLARGKGLEFASGQETIGWAPVSTKVERDQVPEDVANHFIDALSSNNPVVRTEALKDLDGVLYRYRLESESRIMESLIALSDRLVEPSDGRPLELLRYILLQAGEEERGRWVPRVRETALAHCVPTQSAFVAQQALNLLSQFPEIEDLEKILWILCAWPREVYSQAKPLSWLFGLKSKGFLFEAQRALLGRLAQIDDSEVAERIKECLEYLRRS